MKMLSDRKEIVLVALLLLVCIVVFFYPFVFQGRVIQANDILYQYLPFSLDAPEGFEKPHNYLLADQPQEFYPLRHFVKEQVLKGTWPRWLPHIFCGHSILNAIQTEMYYLPNVLLLVMPIPVAETLVSMLQLLGAAVGMLLFLRKHDVRLFSSGIGAVAFAFCSYNIVWMNHGHAAVAVMIPWVLWSFELILTSKRLKVPVALCAIITSLVITAGHPNTIINVFFLGGVYLLFRWITLAVEKKCFTTLFLRVLLTGGAVCLGIGLCAILVMPFVESRLSGDFFYGNRPGAALRASPIPFVKGFTPLVFPHAFGSPLTLNDTNFYNFNENSMFVGVTTLAIILITLPWGIRKRLYIFAVIVIALVMLTLLGVNPISYVVRRIPVLRDNHVQRMVLLMLFSMSVAAATGWDAFVSQIKQLKQGHKVWLIGCIIMIVVLMALLLSFNLNAIDYPWTLIVLCLFVGVILLVLAREGSEKWLSGLLSLIIFGELAIAFMHYNPSMPLQDAILKEPDISHYMKETSHNAWFRMTGLDGTFMPNTGVFFGLNDIRGYEVPILKRYIDFSTYAFCEGEWNYELNYWHCESPGFKSPDNRRFHDLLGVRFALHRNENGRVGLIHNPEAYPHAFFLDNGIASIGSIEGDVELIREGYHVVEYPVAKELLSGPHESSVSEESSDVNHVVLDVETDESAILVLSEAPVPGWSVNVDGESNALFPVNVVQQGAIVPAGKHEVVFTFMPSGFAWGLWLSIGCWLFVIGLFVSAMRKGFYTN